MTARACPAAPADRPWRDTRPRVGLIDGPASAAWRARLAGHLLTATAGIGPVGGTIARGHADDMLDLIDAGCPQAQAILAQVLDARGHARSTDVARAIDELCAQGVDLIHMSLGMRQPCPAVTAACDRALAAGCVLVASAPAQGAAVWPARHPGVVAVTGDARCRPEELAWLDAAHAQFGAHPFWDVSRDPRRGGASHAAARFSGRLLALMHATGLDGLAALALCRDTAAWVGKAVRHA